MADPLPLDATGRPTELRTVDLDRFFAPRTVAVLGASDTPGGQAAIMTTKLRVWSEARGATLYPVNPRRDTVDGHPCFSSLSDVPGPVDLAVVLHPDALAGFAEIAAAGAGFAVVFAAGFAESGAAGVEAQARLEQLVAEGSTRLLGPNTNLNAFELFDTGPQPKVALITQSGHQGRPIFQARQIGLKMSAWAPTGNEVDLEFADFVRYFADQPDTAVIAAYIEGFHDGRTLQLAADYAAQRGVPIVCVKIGRTEHGRSMALSHTGHLTGVDAVTDAVFDQYGVIRVDGLDELQDVSMLFTRAKPPTTDGVCIYAISGGTGAHMADLCSASGLSIPELRPDTRRQLHQWIPEFLRVSNPVDSGGPPSIDERGPKILQAILADPNVGVLIAPLTGSVPAMSLAMAQDFVAAAATTDKPICVVWGAPTTDDPAYEVLIASNVPVFRTFANCVTAVKAYLGYYDFLADYRSPFAKPVRRRSARASAGDKVLAAAGAEAGDDGALSEQRSKELLAAYGIPASRDVLCTTPASAVRAGRQIGFPVVVKVASAAISHKSEHGLVKVGVASAAEVHRVAADLLERAARLVPRSSIDGVLVCEQITDGVECVVGVSTDELFGPTVMVGLGGVTVELFRDVAFRVPPFDRREARRMIDQLTASALLRGFRGAPVADIDALVDVIIAVQRLAVDHAGRLAELDINPLIVRPQGKGAVALDALAVLIRS